LRKGIATEFIAILFATRIAGRYTGFDMYDFDVEGSTPQCGSSWITHCSDAISKQ
jgi:hypothetical protein